MPYYANKNMIGLNSPFATNGQGLLDPNSNLFTGQSPQPPSGFQPGPISNALNYSQGAGGSFDSGSFVLGKPGINYETGQPIQTDANGTQFSMFGTTQPGQPPKGPTINAPAAAPPISGGTDAYPASDPYHLGPMAGYQISSGPVGGSNRISADNSGFLNSILASVTGQYDKANAANEARFKEAKNTLSNFGKSYQNQINEQGAQDLGKAEQDAVSRGLGNTTVRQGLISAATRRKNDATLNLQDRLAQGRVNLLQSKYDNAPDPTQIAALLAQATQGAYGSGGNLGSIAAALNLRK